MPLWLKDPMGKQSWVSCQTLQTTMGTYGKGFWRSNTPYLSLLTRISAWPTKVISPKLHLLRFEPVPQFRYAFFRFQFCGVTPIIKCIFTSKETGLSLIRRGYLPGHLLSHVIWRLLRSSSHRAWFILIPWATIIDNVEVIFVSVDCHWAPVHLEQCSTITWRGAVASFR